MVLVIGALAVRPAFADHHKAAEKSLYNHQVPGPYLKFQVTAQVFEATGGPCKYSGCTMKAHHDHLNITPKEGERGVTLFKYRCWPSTRCRIESSRNCWRFSSRPKRIL